MSVDYKTIELGHTFRIPDLPILFKAVWGGVAWPGKRPGFAVVIGMSHEPHSDSHDIFLLDEFESFDMRELIRQCGAMDLKYAISLPDYSGKSGQWIGDFENDAASRFIQEMNDDSKMHRGQFNLSPTLMLEMENLYSFVLPQIKGILNPDRRMLFLKNSKILSSLSEIESDEITELEIGAYPAIEALAFAVIELLEWEKNSRVHQARTNQSPYAKNVLLVGTKRDPRRRGR